MDRLLYCENCIARFSAFIMLNLAGICFDNFLMGNDSSAQLYRFLVHYKK